MTIAQVAAAKPASEVRISSSLNGFEDLKTPGCAGVVVDRTPLRAAMMWLAAMAETDLPNDRSILAPKHVLAHVLTLLPKAQGTEEVMARDWLANDIATLAQAFCGFMAAPLVRVRLDVVKTNACRKFHIDALKARVVCTYRGQATQYGVSQDGGDPDHIASVPEGCPILLRGTKWSAEPIALRHRSPPIEGTGEARLLLVLDPIWDPEQPF